MTYTCEECGFLFYREGEARECPYCEKKHIRIANAEEIQRLHLLQHKILADMDKKESAQDCREFGNELCSDIFLPLS